MHDGDTTIASKDLTDETTNHHFTTFHAPQGIKIQTTPNFLYDATVTTHNPENSSSYRIFISTIIPEDILLDDQELETLCPKIPEAGRNRLLPYSLYGFRWAIEVIFYEQKTFWSFGKYMVRSKNGIESYVNFLVIAYSGVQLLPFKQKKYTHLKAENSQVKKQLIGMAIQHEVFFYTFVLSIENRIKSLALLKAYEQWIEENHNF